MKHRINIGDVVRHTVPSMLYNQNGIVIADAGMKYGWRYVTVSFSNPMTKKSYATHFHDAVLIKQ